ncbi:MULTISPECIES: ATP-dependent nuclease [Burkholderia]|uniref:ATP-dependent nuclease n=2 Tax=Burkholderiaceae TaxID=119060 RepID=UPI0003ECAA3D|nr:MULTISPECIES: AAA family ATPase [Burkholderia]AHI78483.1 AAA ATPase domain protein [Burkholderia thailandensis E444]AIC86502.1 AAA ATPase domain protein [Burkholderia thailandensis USAMRU Malaysia \
MLRVVDLRIKNFRGIREAHVRLGQHTVLVGANNCGKTTIIEALALLFGRDRMVRSLTEHDFFGSNPQPADRIQLIATIVGFDGDDPAEHVDWFRDDRGVPKWWNPVRCAASATRDDPNWPLACQIGFCARFDQPELEVETARYFHDDDVVGDVFADEAPVAVPGRLIRDIGFFLVPASRSWDRIVSFGSELFRRVVASAGGQPATSVLKERDRLRAPDQPLEADENLEPITTQLNTELAGFFRSKPTLQLRVTATDSDGLLETVVPHYLHAGAPLALPARRHGSGLISLQHLLLLLQFGRQRAQAQEGFWMALEEPELHVPPPLQRRLVHRIQALSSQTFVSTHSPMIAAMSDPLSVLVLRNDDGVLSSVPLLPETLPPAASNGVRKLFQLNRADTIAALMHDAVLVPEGRIDYEWFKLLVRAVDLRQGWDEGQESKFGAYIGLVPTHDAAVEATVGALVRLHPRITALVDGDAAGRAYAQAMAAAAQGPTIIMRWPDDWTIEDVVGWVLAGDADAAITALARVMDPAPQSVPALVARLKSEVRAAGGLKQDQIAYEVVADVIGTTERCCNRARELLNAINDVSLGGDSPRFVAAPGAPAIRTFQP